MNIVVAGAGGFVGRALVERLVKEGHHVDAVYHTEESAKKGNIRAVKSWGDLSDAEFCNSVVCGADHVYNLAAKVGGIDFIKQHRVECILSSQIDMNLLLACRKWAVSKYFFASSACIYPSSDFPIRENYAYPANPERGYGWSKLFGEQLCREFREGGEVETRVARYFTLFGEGDDKPANHVPAALCKRIVTAKILGHDEIEIWGDGTQVRSLLYISDCIEGTLRIMNSGAVEPLNLSSSEAITVNQMADIIENTAGTNFKRKYLQSAVVGVKCRHADNSKIREQLGWEPSTPTYLGLERTYRWWYDKLLKELK